MAFPTAQQASKDMVSLSKEEYHILLDVCRKLRAIVETRKVKKKKSIKTLYGIWQGVKITDEDIRQSKLSLFKA